MRRLALAAALSVLLVSGPTQAQPDAVPALLHLHSPRKACLQVDPQPTGCIPLGPGYYIDEAAFAKLDAEVHRLQDSETRLSAENKSLRATVATWQPGWVTILTVVVTSATLALYIEHRL